MSIRNKTKRRLTVLLVVLLVTAGAVGGGVYHLSEKREREAREHRDQAIAATKEHRYAEALTHFGKAWSRFREDPELFYYFAQARREIPMPNGRHIEESMGYLDKALKLRPNYPEAARELLQMYVGAGRDTEAIDLADRVLASQPSEFEAIRAKAIALVRMRHPEEAVEVLEKGIVALPHEAQLYRLMLNAKREAKEPPSEILRFAREARDAHPDNPRFELVWAYAHGVAGDVAKAGELAAPLAELDAPDADYAVMLVDMLDGVNRFDLSMSVLEKNAAKLEDTRLKEQWVRRLWETGRYEDVLKSLQEIDPASGQTSPDLVAIKAMTLSRQGRAAEAEPLVAALEKRSQEPDAAAWAPVLQQYLNEKDATPAKSLGLLKDALVKDPANPYLLFSVAEAYARLGENEAALEYWGRIVGSTTAPSLAPAWFMPHLRMAQVNTAMGRFQDAILAAQQGIARAPRNPAAHLAWIEAFHQAIESGLGNAQSAQSLLETVEKYRSQVPDHQATLPIYIDLLARTSQRERAVKALTKAVDQPENIGEATLLKLASVSAQHELGLEERVFESLDGAQVTPNAAAARAEYLIDSQGPEAAVRSIESAMSAAGDKSSDLAWRVAHARVLDLAGDPRSRELWRKLTEENAGNLTLQRMALDARALRGDRQVMSQIVERIKAATGSDGLTWRLAEARSLLAEGASEADLLKASNSLKDVLRTAPNLTDARLMLAEAQRRLGVPAEAIAHLAQVLASQPDNTPVRLQLAQMRTEQGDFENARRDLNMVSGDGLSDAQVVQFVSILFTLGEQARGEKLLEEAADENPEQQRIGLMLAQTYARTGRAPQAEEVFKKLMARPTSTTIANYADFLASNNRYDEATQVLTKLDSLGLTAYEREMALFAFHRRTVDRAGVEKVAAHLRAAAQAQPRNPLPRRLLVGLYIDMNLIDDAMKAAGEGYVAMPEEGLFMLFHKQAELMRFALQDPVLRPVAEDAVAGERHRDAAVEAMRIAHDAKQKKEDPAVAARRLRQLAERFPRFLGAQNLLADWYITHNRLEDAAEIAVRTMHAFPNQADPAERAARIFDRLKRWDDVVQPAREWRRRNPAEALQADLFLARSLINQGQPGKALDLLAPYKAAMSDPEKNREAVSVYTAALVAANRADEAAATLRSHLEESAPWRAYWMTLAGTAIREPATSRQWLEQVEPLVPADAEGERVGLAESWGSVAQRSGSLADWDRALAILRPLTEAPEARPVTLVAYAVVLGQKAAAKDQDRAGVAELSRGSEAAYRKALEKEPGNIVALNNLAMLLAERPDGTDEALTLARKAVEAKPDNANAFDTLAYVESQRKDYSAAARNLERAVEIDPGTIDWRINLGLAYLRGGDVKQAQSTLEEIDKRVTRPERLGPDTRKRYDELRLGLTETPAVSTTP